MDLDKIREMLAAPDAVERVADALTSARAYGSREERVRIQDAISAERERDPSTYNVWQRVYRAAQSVD